MKTTATSEQNFQIPKTRLSDTGSEYSRKDLSLEENEKAHLIRVLKMTRGKVRGDDGAAAILQVHPNTLYSRMKKLGITAKTNHMTVQEMENESNPPLGM